MTKIKDFIATVVFFVVWGLISWLDGVCVKVGEKLNFKFARSGDGLHYRVKTSSAEYEHFSEMLFVLNMFDEQILKFERSSRKHAAKKVVALRKAKAALIEHHNAKFAEAIINLAHAMSEQERQRKDHRSDQLK